MLDQPFHRLELNGTIPNLLLKQTLMTPAGNATELSQGNLRIDKDALAESQLVAYFRL